MSGVMSGVTSAEEGPAPRAVLLALRRASAEVTLRAGKALFYQDDRADRAWLVCAGELRRVMYRSDESTAELGRPGRGDWLGLAECVLESVYLADAVAQSGCELLVFSRQGLLRLLDQPVAAAYLLTQMAREHYRLHTRVEVRLPLDRTARVLAERASGGGGSFTGTQDEIASAVGLTRETVNRHLAQLEARGIVRVGRGLVEVLDAETLRGKP